ncbi:MAG: hypothetical protein BMS9Abin28_2483 [Anaerolineae bacterium]|nr:MAG: hypothetical protein BMS9Abin28_2483 [Anaerolineae bacterium]
MLASIIRSEGPSLFTRFRLGALLIGALLFVAACNRPADEPPANLLATSVSSTLTAQPVVQPTSTQPADTPLAGGEIDENTPEPTETLEESSSVPTEEALEVSPTPSNTPIPLEPGDPRAGLDLSDPDYVDDFSERFTWFEFSDPEGATVAWEDGRLRVTDHLTDGILWWTTTAIEAEDSYAEIMAQVSSCSGRDAYGMGIRVGGENIDRGYTLEISCDGAWRVRRFIAFDELPAVLRDWTESDLIQSGPDASNQIGFLANGDQLFAFVNGELLDTVAIEDSGYTSGVPSLFTNASQTADLTVNFDDFRLWYLPP